jgi:hypothetical protein
VRDINRSTEVSASDLAEREEELRRLIEAEPRGPRRRLLRHELRDVVVQLMAAEKAERV